MAEAESKQGLKTEPKVSEEQVQKMIAFLNHNTSFRVVTSDEFDKLSSEKHVSFGHSTPIKGTSAHTRVATYAAGFGNNTTVSCSNSSYAKPKIPVFSGEEKSEVSFDVWKFEVKCIIQEGNYTDTILLQCIRGSLKGKARGLLLSLPDGATPTQIIEKLDGIYGNVFSSEALLQKFYMETQKQGQSVADYGIRLEDIAQKALEKGQINSQAKNDMLRSKLWSGLRDPLLKNASRYKYDTVKKFDQLLKEIRSIELDLSNYASASDNKIQHQPAVVEQSGMQEMIKSMKLLNTRMESFERELKKLKESKPDDHTSSSNSQFRGQGRGNYRGSDRRGRFINNRGWRDRGYTGNQPQNQNYNSQTRGLNG
ncbi:paraneoplastic antigen-like protein 5 [Mytilus edulis]|uniref:paraneoplastic antigen-like protein 5 n=1 Tax=Mytilus edulis TaxID=6550 RepID=UPI0039EE3E5B